MLRQAQGAASGWKEVSKGPLWLAAAAADFADDGSACLAFDGLILADGRSWRASQVLAGLPREAAPAELPVGHYALAYAWPAQRRLTLAREVSGGMRLFFARTGGLLLFSSSARPLLAHPGVSRKLHAPTVGQLLLNGLQVVAGHTLWEGVEELPPGWTLIATPDGVQLRRQSGHPLEVEPARLTALSLRRDLSDAVSRATLGEREVAVSLSGGIDSAVIAALAAEIVGPKNVHGFTCESDDPQSAESSLAGQTAHYLGIRHHRLVMRYEDCLRLLPETLWLAEDCFDVGPSHNLLQARWVRRAGFRTMLTGIGLESMLGIISPAALVDTARVLAAVPLPDWILRVWRLAFAPQGASVQRLRRCLAWLHPGLEPPPLDMYAGIVLVLQRSGLIRDVAPFYPSELRGFVEGWQNLPWLARLLGGAERLPLRARLKYLRWETLARRMEPGLKCLLSERSGCMRTVPATFLLGSGYVSGQFARDDCDNRPLLCKAMEDLLPAELFRRPKQPPWMPRSWRHRLTQFLAETLAADRDHLQVDIPGLSALATYEEREFVPRPMFSFRAGTGFPWLTLWCRLFVDRIPPPVPPSWRDLLGDRVPPELE